MRASLLQTLPLQAIAAPHAMQFLLAFGVLLPQFGQTLLWQFRLFNSFFLEPFSELHQQ